MAVFELDLLLSNFRSDPLPGKGEKRMFRSMFSLVAAIALLAVSHGSVTNRTIKVADGSSPIAPPIYFLADGSSPIAPPIYFAV